MDRNIGINYIGWRDDRRRNSRWRMEFETKLGKLVEGGGGGGGKKDGGKARDHKDDSLCGHCGPLERAESKMANGNSISACTRIANYSSIRRRSVAAAHFAAKQS